VVQTGILLHWQFIFLPVHFLSLFIESEMVLTFLPIVKRCMSTDKGSIYASTVSIGL
jgi:hypothetical protein